MAIAATHARGEPPLLVASSDVQAPSDDQVVELADNSMRIFMASVREKSMRGLWDHISLRFRQKFSVAQLDEVVQGLLRPADNRRSARREKPDLHGGSRRSTMHGNLIVDGYYATTPSRVSFHLVFAMEGRTWKLIDINVSAKPAMAPAGGTRQSTAEKVQSFQNG